MEIQIKAYAYTIDIITEIRYFCKCNNAVFGKFRIIFTCAISKTDCSLHHSFHALFKISGNGKFVRTAVLPQHPSRNLSKSTPRPRPAPLHQPSQNRTIPCFAPHSCHMNALLVSHPCETLGVQLRASMPLYERSVGFASLRNSGRSTSGIHARPLSKVRCCRPKEFGRLPEGLLFYRTLSVSQTPPLTIPQ